MRLRLYQVDAFTDRLFGGNPAAVVPLEEWPSDAMLQAIAAENNLSETAFFCREGEDYRLRWFTPRAEVPLCGHATLASAHVIFRFLEPELQRVVFHTQKAGTLTVSRLADELVMDFPAWPAAPIAMLPGLAAALGHSPTGTLATKDGRTVALFAAAQDLTALAPNIGAIERLDCYSVLVTAPGEGAVDFVSRYFAPKLGVPEDPVTGSAHCILVPYWAERLGKTRLRARQVSARGGDLSCTLAGDRVTLGGKAVLYLEGMITV